MKNKLFWIIAVVLSGSTTCLYAQMETAATDSPSGKALRSNEKNQQHFNFIKTNLTGIILKNYSIQYERTLTKKISAAIAFRIMPASTIPFKNEIINLVKADSADTKDAIEKLKLGNFAVTPEVRFYLSRKGAGRGFYIAPFYRFASFTTNQMVFTYEDNSNVKNTITLSGKLTSNTGGILLGAQWFLGKNVCLDWWILGPHYGSGTGNFSGVSGKIMTPDEQADLKKQLNDFDIPLTNKTVTVTPNSATVKLDGPWGGVRAGLSIGFRF